MKYIALLVAAICLGAVIEVSSLPGVALGPRLLGLGHAAAAGSQQADGGAVSIRPGSLDGGRMTLSPGRDQPVTFRRTSPGFESALLDVLSAPAGAPGVPLAMTSADLDEDGVADLVTTYGSGTSGSVAVQRGNVDARFPNAPDALDRKARGQYSDLAFSPDASVVAVPSRPDFVAAGDFDADGHADMVIATTGGDALWWLRGDGHGALLPPTATKLPGAITTMRSGEINRRDGLADVVVAVTAPAGSSLLVFEGPSGAANSTPESIALPAPAIDLALGQLDDQYPHDLAVLTRGDLLILPGRDRKLSLDYSARASVPPPALRPVAPGMGGVAVAAGKFLDTDEEALAILGADGAVALLDPRLPADTVLASARSASVPPPMVGAMAGARSPALVRTHTGASRNDQVVVVAAGGTELALVGLDTAGQTQAAEARAPVSMLAVTSKPVAVLPMRLNADVLDDLIVLKDDPAAPLAIATTASGLSFTVTTVECTDTLVLAQPPHPKAKDGVCDTGTGGTCPIDEALAECSNYNAANGTTGCNISFNVPVSGTMPSVCMQGDYLNVVTVGGTELMSPFTMDASTQPGGMIRIAGHVDPLTFPTATSLKNVVMATIKLRDYSVVTGSYIGVDADGTTGWSLSGWPFGIELSSNSTIGGTVPAARNLIANSHTDTGFAIQVNGNSNTISGNYFGLGPTGTLGPGSAGGVYVRNSGSGTPPHDNVIGGIATGSRNLFVTDRYAVWLDYNTSACLVQGNYFGMDKDGTTALGIYEAIRALGKGNTVGGTTDAARNVIVGPPNTSTAVGIHIMGPPADTENLVVQGNYIGTNPAGAALLGKLYTGIEIGDGAQAVTVGGTAVGAGNVIASATNKGIYVNGSDTRRPTGIIVQGNLIGTDRTGLVALPNATGVYILSSNDNRIGGSTPGARNVISGNSGGGITIGAMIVNNVNVNPPTGNTVEGNYIGVGADGTTSLGNSTGIYLSSGAANTTIGAADPNAANAASTANVIASSTFRGVSLAGSTGNGNRIGRNSIYSNGWMGIDLGGDGITPIFATSPNPGPNQYQNPPVLTVAETGTGFNVNGTLHSVASQTFDIDFYGNCALTPYGVIEAKTWLKRMQVSTSSLGDAIFNTTFPVGTCPLIAATATDLGGNTSELSILGTVAKLNAATGGTLNYTDGRGLEVSLSVPAGSLDQEYMLSLTWLLRPLHSVAGPLSFAGRAFNIEAYRKPGSIWIRTPGLAFVAPVTVMVQYSDADVALIGGTEADLRLRYWDGSGWIDAATTCTPTSTYTRDLSNNKLSLPICHLSEYALTGPAGARYVYLPLIQRRP